MSPRSAGSGLYGDTSVAIEEMLAALLREDRSAVAEQRGRLLREEALGLCGVSPATIEGWLRSLVSKLALPVRDARRQIGGHCDVLATLENGAEVAIEVKGQTTKTFDDLIQADWIRGDTDFMRALVWDGHEAAGAIRPTRQARLRNSGRPPAKWTLSALLAADVLLLPTVDSRHQAGVHDPADLWDYAGRKWLVHLSLDGARAVLLSSLELVRASLAEGQVAITGRRRKVSDALWINTTVGRPDMLYYVYDPPVLGRHKLANRAVVGADWFEA